MSLSYQTLGLVRDFEAVAVRAITFNRVVTCALCRQPKRPVLEPVEETFKLGLVWIFVSIFLDCKIFVEIVGVSMHGIQCY